MWSLESLRRINQQAANKAHRLKKKPRSFTVEQLRHAIANRGEGVAVPSLGSFTPDGWVDTLEAKRAWRMVDKSWQEKRDGPAMTIREMLEWMLDLTRQNPKHAFAVVDEGPFQLHVSAFLPEEKLQGHQVHEDDGNPD